MVPLLWRPERSREGGGGSALEARANLLALDLVADGFLGTNHE